MEIVTRAAAVAVVGSILSLLLRKHAAEQAMALTLITGLVIVWISATVASQVAGSLRKVAETAALGSVYISPVLKCIGIGLVTHLAAQVCRDAQQGSLASAVELCGTLCALYVSLPLVESLLATAEKLL